MKEGRSLGGAMVGAGLLTAGAYLLWRLYSMTWLFASNVPFSDQWALWTLLFDGFQWSDLWQAYQYQHGPHRQGLSFALMVPMYQWTGWNIRLEALFIASTLVLSGCLALRLRRKLLPGPLVLWDILILLGFWGVLGHETIFVAPNASHSIAPLALLMLWANLWVAPAKGWRTGLLLLLTHALCFTGFGVAAMPSLVFVLVLQMWRGPETLRARNAVLLLGALASGWHFSMGYFFNPAVANFDGHQPALTEYAQFLAALMQFFLQRQNSFESHGWYLYGLVYLLMLFCVGLWALWRTGWREVQIVERPLPYDAPFWPVVLLMVGVTLGFAVLTTYGRTLLGVPAAMASRYTVLMLPGFFALYLVALRFRRQTVIPLLVLAVTMLARQNPENRLSRDSGEVFGGVRACWLQAYKKSGDFEQANEQTAHGFPQVGFQRNWMGSPEQWDYLKAHQLGPYSGFSRRWGVSAFQPRQCPP